MHVQLITERQKGGERKGRREREGEKGREKRGGEGAGGKNKGKYVEGQVGRGHRENQILESMISIKKILATNIVMGTCVRACVRMCVRMIKTG